MNTVNTVVFFVVMGTALLYGAILMAIWIRASIRCYKGQQATKEAWQQCVDSNKVLEEAEAKAKVHWDAGRERRLAILMGE